MVRVQVCGGVVVEAEGRPLPDALLSGRQGRLVLAYLLCERHRSVPREELAGLLWGEQLPASWALSLSAIVSKLRRLFTEAGLDGVATLASAFGSYRLRLPDETWVDWDAAASSVERAEQALRDGAVEAALEAATVAEVIAGRGFLTEDCPWVDAQRVRLHDLHARAVRACCEAHLLAGDRGRAVEAARRAIELDDLQESGYRLLMRALAAAGERGEALRVWDRCRGMLADELGIDPAPESEAVYLSILCSELPDGDRSAADRPTHNLPTFRTSLIGREADCKSLASLMRERRLVTITGSGGVGKTRLAVEFARELVDEIAGGVAFVDLLEAEAASEVPAAFARAVDVTSVGDIDDLTAVCTRLRSREVCLLVDNCEHVLDAAATAVEAILDACSGVTLLATSRVPLGVPGEQLYRLAPLPAPAMDDGDEVSIAGFEAVQLFDDRIRLGLADFALREVLGDAAAICRRLDGVPLAIELAAARVRTLGVAEVARRLDDRFRLLSRSGAGGHRGKDSMRSVIAWSYDLLSEDDQRCFRSLAVFVDGFTLDAADAVVGGDAADTVGRLVDHCLVEFGDSRPGRYRMLDSIRAFASGALVERDEVEQAAQAHCDFFVSLIGRGSAALGGREQLDWLERVAPEHPNVNAALSFAHERGQAALLVRLAVAMREFWEFAGRYRDAERWLRVATEAYVERNADRARALAAAAATAHVLGDEDGARALGREALALGEQLGNELVVSEACVALSRTAVLGGDFPTALALARRGIEAAERAGAWRAAVEAKRTLGLVHSIAGDQEPAGLYEEIAAVCAAHGDISGLATALANLGVGMIEVERIDEGRAYLTQALELHRKVGHRFALAMCLGNLGYAALVAGDLDEARLRNEEALAIAEDTGHAISVTFVLINLAETALVAGDHVTAQRRYDECLSLARQLGQLDRICLSADGLGALALADGHAAQAVRLLSAAAAARDRQGITLEHRYQIANERVLVECREQLGAIEFSARWTAGRTLDLFDPATLEPQTTHASSSSRAG